MLPCPSFSTTTPRFDMDTYLGRTFYFFSTINPLLCFETSNSLKRHQELLNRVAAGEEGVASDRQLWKARTAIEICVHPTTKEVIFPPYRMCAFLPVNSFIVPFMMSPTTIASPALTIFIQWFNQSYNCAVNYANRSSDKQPMSELSKAYVAAVGVSCAGALGATAMLKKVKGGTLKATAVRAGLPFVAVSAAAIVNLSLMRKNEWIPSGTGLQVVDEDGEVRGSSRVAGMQSLMMCSVTRVTWNLISMVLPLLMMRPLLARCAAVRARPVVYETALQIASLGVGVPLALGAFSTTVSVPANRLEPELRGLKRKDGSPVEIFTYYKGL
ncbi:tricarboxylate carrier, putative [Trypanosoma brucei brucei TREU927]|uniref:Tricarboxylate carrier, putative n=2 Tax=Trypanosoma brucei TaxID=5691 RepID=Q38FB0_TRYB2|nr:tricarboxylate carrier, putative [Trypanosoma brucei brucei TREU927]EAN76510.1 tricarboxylate carrier, putative [Trypanosoma brucei brucei TREU927]RHW70039.1 tricarboxylate carrier [Trypanosoma brucei equiperdum]